MGCQLHELLGRVVKSRAWSGVWQVEVFQRHDDVYRGDIRVEVALAKVHVHVELLFAKFANLPEGRNFFEEGMAESVLGEEAGQIAADRSAGSRTKIPHKRAGARKFSWRQRSTARPLA